jgi:hypothetical protein
MSSRKKYACVRFNQQVLARAKNHCEICHATNCQLDAHYITPREDMSRKMELLFAKIVI